MLAAITSGNPYPLGELEMKSGVCNYFSE